jgi:lipid-A-disaccharide synthase-like uncharacterized protein
MTLHSFPFGACCIYFLVGVVLDAIITIYYRAISSRRVLRASFLAFVITGATVLLIENIVISRNPVLILAYALGTSVGTWIGMSARR